MLFTSIEFIFFLCFTVILYFLAPLNRRWIVLLAASSIFYCLAGLKYIPYIMVTSLATYATACRIDGMFCELDGRLEKEELDREQKKCLKEQYKRKCKKTVILSLLIALGILCYSKFGSFVVERIQKFLDILGMTPIESSKISIIVPLGISYYTFSAIGYMLDVYWRRYRAEKNFFKYLLYILYFPHILQGPIARFDRLGHQLTEGHKFDYKRVCFGIQLMVWGCFKKLVIADRLALFVNTVFADSDKQKGFVILIATFFWAMEFYADFSGCVDMARGMSQIFGIQLDNNFRQPYFSKSVEEYWRRWHITLGTWFKDYLYRPVSVSAPVKKLSQRAKTKWGNQAGKRVIIIISLSIVWLATGIWHGTGWNYVLWGMWNGCIIITSTLLENKYTVWKQKVHMNDQSCGWKIFQTLRTFLLVGIIPRILTRAGSVGEAITIYKNIFAEFNIWVFFDQSLYQYGLDRQDFWIAILSILLLIAVDIWKEKGVQIRETIASRNIVIRWIVYYLAIFSIIILGIYGSGYDASDFIYMKF